MTTRANPQPNREQRQQQPGPPPPSSNSHHQNHRYYYPTTPYRYSSSSSASLKGCCCCLFFLALLVLAVILVIFLALKPKKPQFDLQQVGVQYLGITPNPPSNPASMNTADGTSASLSLTIRLLFTSVNHNKVGIKYGQSKFTIMYRGILLGEASAPGFYKESHSVRQIVGTNAVDRANLLQANAADLIKDASLNDRVVLRVLGDDGAKIRIMNFDSPGVKVPLSLSP